MTAQCGMGRGHRHRLAVLVAVAVTAAAYGAGTAMVLFAESSGRSARVRLACGRTEQAADPRRYSRKRNHQDAPVFILHPSRVKKGHQMAPYHNVFKVWRREISKPDFNIKHAAKAVRLLPNCRFIGFDASDKVWVNLMNRSRELLTAGGVGGREVAAMVWAAATLRVELPQLQEALLPSLLPLVSQTIGDMDVEDLGKLVRAASQLRDVAPELWEVLPLHLELLAEKAATLKDEDLVEVSELIATMPEDCRSRAQALQALAQDVLRRIEDFTLPLLARALPIFVRTPVGVTETRSDLEEELWEATSTFVARQARFWNKKDVEPHLWLVAVHFARHRRRDASVLRAVARRALRDELARLSGWGLSALLWSYEELATPRDGLADFRRHLWYEAELRGLPTERLAASSLGPDGGGNQVLRDLWAGFGPRQAEQLPLLAPRPCVRQPMHESIERKPSGTCADDSAQLRFAGG